MNMNWQLKSRLFRLFSYLPQSALHFVQRRVTKRATVHIEEIPLEWKDHARNLRMIGARSVIEFGGGQSLAQNLYLASLGIEQTVVDIEPMLDLGQVNEAIRALRRLGHPVGGPVANLAELSDRYRIAYLAPVDVRATPFDDAQFDACISTNTLEHIPAEHIPTIFAELRRIVRPGGCISAAIDYSDHYSHTDRRIDEHNFLRFSERRWRRHNHRDHFQNRLRHGHYRTLFADAGFDALADAPVPGPALPNDVRRELLVGDGLDHCTQGRFLLANSVAAIGHGASTEPLRPAVREAA